jgi:predicted ribosome quality control (RQC) complex YloA/Tae2 family protein
MSFDALTLAAVTDELTPVLAEARIQKLVFVNELSVALEAFSPHTGRTYILLSADFERARVQRLRELKLPARGLERDSPFSLQIRKHLRNARIRSVHQPRLERVFELDCEQRDSSARVKSVTLIVEAMGRRSNLVLVDQDRTILDAARRTPPSRNPRRPILPHVPYSPPPPQDRLMPEELSADRLAADAAAGAPSLAKYLSMRIAGLSPLAARELTFRAMGSVDATVAGVDWTRLVDVARNFLGVIDTHAWDPTVAFDGDLPLEFAPYALTHLTDARLERFASISEAMDVYYSRRADGTPARRGDQLAAERKALLAPLERAAHTTERRIAGLAHQLELAGNERDLLRRAGEGILAHQADIPAGAHAFDLDGERIELDPQLSAVENAQAYFARYRKAREAEERVPRLLEEARHAAEYLAELRTLVEVADQMDAIRALRREVAAASGSPAPEPKLAKPTSKSAPYRRIALTDGCEALVGTSAEGNATVTFDLARPEDLWLHARGVPGAHVILRTNATTPPDHVLQAAAQLAATHSAARQSGSVEVDITQKRHVKKIPGGPPGLVRYSNERTLRVSPTEERSRLPNRPEGGKRRERSALPSEPLTGVAEDKAGLRGGAPPARRAVPKKANHPRAFIVVPCGIISATERARDWLCSVTKTATATVTVWTSAGGLSSGPRTGCSVCTSCRLLANTATGSRVRAASASRS